MDALDVALAVTLVAAAPVAGQLPSLEPLGQPIGCATCDDTRAFGAVMGVSVLPDGGVAVADRDEPVVRPFGPDGSARAAFGRHGEGPGEIRRPGGVAATASGTFVVSDFMGRALTEFDGAGELVDLHGVEGMATGLRTDAAGRWLAWEEADWATFTASVHVRAADGSAEGVPVPTTAGVVVDDDDGAAGPGGFASAPGPDGQVAVGHPMVYRIEVFDRNGTPLRTLTRDIERTRRSPAEIQDLEGALDRMPSAPNNPEAGASRPAVDPLRPHFFGGGLAYDDRGRLWVRTARGGPDATVFDVFDGAGAYLGEVDVPVFVRPFALAHGVLAGVVSDPDTGVERVHRWRIVG